MTGTRALTARAPQLLSTLLLLGAAGSVLAFCALGRARELPLATYATSLRLRTDDQAYNAMRAASALEGAVLRPGGILSFNAKVGPCTADQGYRKAAVSYDGELVPAFGGGVCQTSTTLYNAALLAGLEIVERHCHHWPPPYIPPGRDAAVAYPGVDLRIRNPYRHPVRLRARITRDVLSLSLVSPRPLPHSVSVQTHPSQVLQPSEVIRFDGALPSGARRTLNPGHPGYRVTVHREFRAPNGHVRRERLSSDVYPAMNRLTQVGR